MLQRFHQRKENLEQLGQMVTLEKKENKVIRDLQDPKAIKVPQDSRV